VDLSKKAIDFSRLTHRMDGLEFKVGDAESLPFPDNTFDAVINVESSHCYPAFETFLSEVRRVLRPGGHFLYADFRERSAVDVWRRALQSSGLEMLRETYITPNVVSALEIENDRKVEWINRLIPGIIRPSFLNFAAVRGSGLFESFRSGQLVYMSFVLRRR
jgi:ubiquinone/menaquinone biosynthesis C-methylase UbiE